MTVIKKILLVSSLLVASVANAQVFSCVPLEGSRCGLVMSVTADNQIIEAVFDGGKLEYCNGTWRNEGCIQNGTVKVLDGTIAIEEAAKYNLKINLKSRKLYCFVLFGPAVCTDQ